MREYFVIFVVAGAITYFATPFVRAVAVATNAFTPVRERDVHSTPTPRLGGVAIFLGFAAAGLVARELPYLKGVYSSGQISGVLMGAAIVCLVGAIDDIRELDWLTKLAGQILAAGVMAYKGVQLLSVPFFGTSTVLPTPVLVAVTVIVVLATVNAVNFIDGLDGLAVGVVAIAALAFFIYSYYISNSYNPPNVFSNATFISAAVLGCCLGFLPHNFHPARLFMGDSGALLLGYTLAAISVEGLLKTASLVSLFLPLAVLAVPIVDTSFVVAKRLKHGLPVYESDRSHLHHRFLNIGYSQPRAVLTIYAWCATLAAAALATRFIQPHPHGDWRPWAAAVDALIGLAALAASVYIVYLLEIFKLANPILRRREQLARERKTA